MKPVPLRFGECSKLYITFYIPQTSIVFEMKTGEPRHFPSHPGLWCTSLVNWPFPNRLEREFNTLRVGSRTYNCIYK